MEEASSKKSIYTMFQYVHSFFFLFIFAIITSVLLVYPKYSYISILLQLVCINLWVYAMHRLSHALPNIPVNYHLYSHHNKQLNLPRPIELVFEFITDFSWYLLLLAFQYYYKLSFLSPTLIIFLGLWYSSVHTINLSLFDDKVHKTHHIEPTYNYGPPYIDFLFGTLKMDPSYTTNSEIANGIGIFFLLKALHSIFQFE
jgi:hypothetical protein